MAASTTPGWEAESSSIIKATLPTRLLPSAGTGPGGAADRVVVKGNISNGNYDVYRPGLFGDTLIYSRNASTNSVVVHNQSLYNARFNQKDANGVYKVAVELCALYYVRGRQLHKNYYAQYQDDQQKAIYTITKETAGWGKPDTGNIWQEGYAKATAFVGTLPETIV